MCSVADALAKNYFEVSAEERQFFERIAPYVATSPRVGFHKMPP